MKNFSTETTALINHFECFENHCKKKEWLEAANSFETWLESYTSSPSLRDAFQLKNKKSDTQYAQKCAVLINGLNDLLDEISRLHKKNSPDLTAYCDFKQYCAQNKKQFTKLTNALKETMKNTTSPLSKFYLGLKLTPFNVAKATLFLLQSGSTTPLAIEYVKRSNAVQKKLENLLNLQIEETELLKTRPKDERGNSI